MVRTPSSLARLKKFIITEDVQMTVPVQRKEVRVVREPVTDANLGCGHVQARATEEEHEVTLMEEQMVVHKEVVPEERVRLDKSVGGDEKVV